MIFWQHDANPYFSRNQLIFQYQTNFIMSTIIIALPSIWWIGFLSKNALVKIIKATTWGSRHNISPPVVALQEKKHGLHSKKKCRLMGIIRMSGCSRHAHVADMKGMATREPEGSSLILWNIPVDQHDVTLLGPHRRSTFLQFTHWVSACFLDCCVSGNFNGQCMQCRIKKLDSVGCQEKPIYGC